MTRVSFPGIFNGSTRYTEQNAERLFDLQRQLATGKAIAAPSDDPRVAMQSQRLSTKIRRSEQLVRNIDSNTRLLTESEELAKSAISQLQRLRDLALQGINGTLVTADMNHIAAEINQHLEGMLRIGNTQVLGKRVFAGADVFEDAFTATRNGIGEITAVTYDGDDVELEVDADGNVPVSWPGNRVFATSKTTRASTVSTWNGSTRANYADREIAAAFVPTSGTVNGTLRINGTLINYDLDGNPTTGEGDSLLDVAKSINDAKVGVKASVTGVMRGTVTTTSATFTSSLPPFQAGSFTLNGATISVTGQDSIFTLAERINASFSSTEVTASVLDANNNVVDGTPGIPSSTPPYRLQLSGGVGITDNGSGNSNIMGLLGITASPAAATGQNLTGTVTQNYKLEITGDRPGPFTIEDASGSLAADLGLTSSAAITKGKLVFDTLIKFRDAFRNGDAATVESSVLGEITEALSSLEVIRTEAGVRTERMNLQKSRIEETILNTKAVLSEFEDVDLTEVISNLRQQQATNEAALRATADLMNLTLLELLS